MPYKFYASKRGERPDETKKWPKPADLSKTVAFAVFGAIMLTSLTYGPGQIIAGLWSVGPQIALLVAPWVALAIVLVSLLLGWVFSRAAKAYPNGVGNYAIIRDNLGLAPALVAGVCLIVNFLFAVSVSATVAAAYITASLPSLGLNNVYLAVGLVFLIGAAQLVAKSLIRYVTTVSIYGFLALLLILCAVVYTKYLQGTLVAIEQQNLFFLNDGIVIIPISILSAVIIFRTFASGSITISGIELVNEATRYLRSSRPKNTVILTVCLLIVSGFFLLTLSYLGTLALHGGAGPTGASQHLGPLISALADSVYTGSARPLFYLTNLWSILALLSAIHVAYSSVNQVCVDLSFDGFLPKSLSETPRPSFSATVSISSFLSALVIFLSGSNLSVLLDIYTLAVFLVFFFFQGAMVRYWTRAIASATQRKLRQTYRRYRLGTLVSLATSIVVFVIIFIWHFFVAQWIGVAFIALLCTIMYLMRTHYQAMDSILGTKENHGTQLSAKTRAFILVRSFDASVSKALNYALASQPTAIEYLVTCAHKSQADQIRKIWVESRNDIVLTTLMAPTDTNRVIKNFFIDFLRHNPDTLLYLYVPYIVPKRFYQNFLHNHFVWSLRRYLGKLDNCAVVLVPFNAVGAGKTKKKMSSLEELGWKDESSTR